MRKVNFNDPKEILVRMCALQSVYYVGYMLCLKLWDLIFSVGFTMG